MSQAGRVDLHCSAQARTGDIRPIGTAVPVRTFALIELPLPWPSHIDEHPTLEGVEEALAPLDARIQGIVPSSDATASGEYRVALWFRRSGPFRSYERVEARGSLSNLVETCRSLLHEVIDAIDSGRPSPAPEHELLVCTHGARDRCCGSMGTVTFAAIDEREGLRLRRTSHLGGHRFAPTAALLPEGTVWAWLDRDLIAGILDRSIPVESVIEHYRGSAAIDGPALQAAEAAVFAEVGWSWLDGERSAEVREHAGDRWTVGISGSGASWTAEVVNLGDVPQPKCGSDEPSGKTDPQLEVVSLSRGA